MRAIQRAVTKYLRLVPLEIKSSMVSDLDVFEGDQRLWIRLSPKSFCH